MGDLARVYDGVHGKVHGVYTLGLGCTHEALSLGGGVRSHVVRWSCHSGSMHPAHRHMRVWSGKGWGGGAWRGQAWVCVLVESPLISGPFLPLALPKFVR